DQAGVGDPAVASRLPLSRRSGCELPLAGAVALRARDTSGFHRSSDPVYGPLSLRSPAQDSRSAAARDQGERVEVADQHLGPPAPAQVGPSQLAQGTDHRIA